MKGEERERFETRKEKKLLKHQEQELKWKGVT
jgi:hypothetical protein